MENFLGFWRENNKERIEETGSLRRFKKKVYKIEEGNLHGEIVTSGRYYRYYRTRHTVKIIQKIEMRQPEHTMNKVFR